MSETPVLHERHCPICDKAFCPPNPDEWAYKVGTQGNCRIFFCSWHCLREHEKKREKPERKKKLDIVGLAIQQLVSQGKRPTEIAELLDISTDKVRYWQEKWSDNYLYWEAKT